MSDLGVTQCRGLYNHFQASSSVRTPRCRSVSTYTRFIEQQHHLNTTALRRSIQHADPKTRKVWKEEKPSSKHTVLQVVWIGCDSRACQLLLPISSCDGVLHRGFQPQWDNLDFLNGIVIVTFGKQSQQHESVSTLVYKRLNKLVVGCYRPLPRSVQLPVHNGRGRVDTGRVWKEGVIFCNHGGLREQLVEYVLCGKRRFGLQTLK